MGVFIDLTGQTFHRLTVVRLAYTQKRYGAWWLCKCVCGNEVVKRGDGLKDGDIQSCGCLHREQSAERLRKQKTTHGQRNSRGYEAWSGAKSRCYNVGDPVFGHYGGRGITMCQEWRESFAAFFADMGLCPPGLTLERNEVNGNYEKSNCRWATRTDQQRNKRNNHRISYNGKTQSLAAWAEESGLHQGLIFRRIQLGWPADRIFQTPVRR